MVMPGWVDMLTGTVVMVGGMMVFYGCIGVWGDLIAWIWRHRYARSILLGSVVMALAGVARSRWGIGGVGELVLGAGVVVFGVWMVRGWLLGLLGLLAPYGWFRGEK
jgi:hypothetical protein